MAIAPRPPAPPTFLTVDPVAAEEAVTRLRLAAEAALLEQARQARSLAAATVTWIGHERAATEQEATRLQQAWGELANDLRRAATDVRFAELSAQSENRARQAAFDEATATYRTALAAAAAADAPPSVG